MDWFAWPFIALRNFLCLTGQNKETAYRRFHKSGLTGLEENQKTPFYSHIPTSRIHSYQQYVDRAFALSPTLEFSEKDGRFNRLLKEAANEHELSQLDLELMRMQYVLADPSKREPFRHHWAIKVINRKNDDFFPSPWAILKAVFAESRESSFRKGRF